MLPVISVLINKEAIPALQFIVMISFVNFSVLYGCTTIQLYEYESLYLILLIDEVANNNIMCFLQVALKHIRTSLLGLYILKM